MKKHVLLSFLILAGVQLVNAQTQPTTALANLKAQATQMGNAYLAKDYKRFTGFMYPGVISKSGGAANMINGLQQADNYMKANGIKLTKFTLDEPLKLVTVDKELQSSIVQHSVVQTANGLVSTSTTLIAFSDDKGATWKFLDAGKKDRTVLKTVAPKLSPDVDIPAPTGPTAVK